MSTDGNIVRVHWHARGNTRAHHVSLLVSGEFGGRTGDPNVNVRREAGDDTSYFWRRGEFKLLPICPPGWETYEAGFCPGKNAS